MSKVYILQGLPGSGKSTWAREFAQEKEKQGKSTYIINFDTWRKLSPYSSMEIKEREKTLKEDLKKEIKKQVKRGIDYILIDNTNLSPSSVRNLTDFLKEQKIYYEFVDHFLDVPVLECIKRDLQRKEGERVGAEVILKFEKNMRLWKEKRIREEALKTIKRYERIKNKLLSPSRGDKQKASIIVDIDGTVATIPPGGRGPYTPQRMLEDLPKTPVIDMIGNWIIGWYARTGNGDAPHIFFFSGRENEKILHPLTRKETDAKSLTLEWLKKNVISYLKEYIGSDIPFTYSLTIRKEGDKRPDQVVKKEMFEALTPQERNSVLYVFDDRDRVVQMWRSLDLQTFQVAFGDF